MILQNIFQILLAIGAVAEIILYIRAENRLRKHITAPRNRHYEQDKELLQMDVKSTATCMIIAIAIMLTSTLI